MLIILFEPDQMFRALLESQIYTLFTDVKIIHGRDSEHVLELLSSGEADCGILCTSLYNDNEFRGKGSQLSELPIVLTVHEHSAVPRFLEIHAIDYLLKSATIKRIRHALDKLETALLGRKVVDLRILANALLQRQPNKLGNLILKETRRERIVNTEQIKFIKAAGNYIELHLSNGKTILHRGLLKSIEDKLDDSRFYRIHKSVIVKADLISEIKSTATGGCTVKLETGEEFGVSRRRKEVMDKLGNYV